MRKRRLPRSGRAPEDQRLYAAAFDDLAQDAAGPEEVVLADELVERPRAHAIGERRRASALTRGVGGKEIRLRVAAFHAGSALSSERTTSTGATCEQRLLFPEALTITRLMPEAPRIVGLVVKRGRAEAQELARVIAARLLERRGRGLSSTRTARAARAQGAAIPRAAAPARFAINPPP